MPLSDLHLKRNIYRIPLFKENHRNPEEKTERLLQFEQVVGLPTPFPMGPTAAPRAPLGNLGPGGTQFETIVHLLPSFILQVGKRKPGETKGPQTA